MSRSVMLLGLAATQLLVGVEGQQCQKFHSYDFCKGNEGCCPGGTGCFAHSNQVSVCLSTCPATWGCSRGHSCRVHETYLLCKGNEGCCPSGTTCQAHSYQLSVCMASCPPGWACNTMPQPQPQPQPQPKPAPSGGCKKPARKWKDCTKSRCCEAGSSCVKRGSRYQCRPSVQQPKPQPQPQPQPPQGGSCQSTTGGGTGSDGGISTPVSKKTGHTVTKVRTAVKGGMKYIVGTSYEGTVFGMKYDGTMLWERKLAGYMNADIWCADVRGDADDEILVASTDGSVYCLNATGRVVWERRPSRAPMNAVVVMHDPTGKPYVVAGGYDTNIYYLAGDDGEVFETIASSTYSREKTFGKGRLPPPFRHIANFLRVLQHADGTESLLLHGTQNSHTSGGGTLYLFRPLATSPYEKVPVGVGIRIGDLRIVDTNDDGESEVLVGASDHTSGSGFALLEPLSGVKNHAKIGSLKKQFSGGFGYRVTQTEAVKVGGTYVYFALHGSRLFLTPLDMDLSKAEILVSEYSYNDMWLDREGNNLLLASSQSGGSCVHILDLSDGAWKTTYENLVPPGKIRAILDNDEAIRTNLDGFEKPAWERGPTPSTTVTFVSEDYATVAGNKDWTNPRFLEYRRLPGKELPAFRSGFTSETYKNKRDKRQRYTATSDEVVQSMAAPTVLPGVCTWGGHGNDPFFYSLETSKKVIAELHAMDKTLTYIYPELQDSTGDFEFVQNELLFPLAEFGRDKGLKIHLRNKNIFWVMTAYTPLWSEVLTGKYADVFVPSMEETSAKTMEISVAARIGLWASGVFNSWGTRMVPDMSSFNRLRQFSTQELPNLYVRTCIFHLAYGATQVNNLPELSVVWDLVRTGALYVPKVEEIVSFSPVHLSMLKPDHDDVMFFGESFKFLTHFEEENDEKVFSRLSGAWPAAPNTEWDFSRYAAGARDRRLNYLPPYENGMVLITPPQTGAQVQSDAVRAPLATRLHPLYKDILHEHFTDGKKYYDADGTSEHKASTYYRTMEADLEASKKKLPLTVTGDVAWVVAQTAAEHLRLTLIDSGFLNPSTKTATVTFHTVKPVRIEDVLDGSVFPSCGNPSSVKINIPTGSYRFIDIKLAEKFYP